MRYRDILKSLYLSVNRVIPHNSIYMFHHVQLDPKFDKSACKISTDGFQTFLKKTRIVPLSDLIKSDYSSDAALTFDDGLEDVYSIAFPILKKNNIPFTIFVLADCLGEQGYINEEQLIEMSGDPLVTIGIHGSKHRILTDLGNADLYDEIVLSKRKIEQIIKKECAYFAYSHGQYNNTVIDVVVKAGFTHAFAVRGKRINDFTNTNNYSIPRISIEENNYKMVSD